MHILGSWKYNTQDPGSSLNSQVEKCTENGMDRDEYSLQQWQHTAVWCFQGELATFNSIVRTMWRAIYYVISDLHSVNQLYEYEQERCWIYDQQKKQISSEFSQLNVI